VFFSILKTNFHSNMETPLDVLSRAASLMNSKQKPGELRLLVVYIFLNTTRHFIDLNV
jgi:hypothetical protein